jgi:hypothetical protein
MSKENLLLSTLSIQFTSLQNTVVLGFRYVCIFGVSYMTRWSRRALLRRPPILVIRYCGTDFVLVVMSTTLLLSLLVLSLGAVQRDLASLLKVAWSV